MQDKKRELLRNMAFRLRNEFRNAKITQMEVAKGTGMKQWQISRLLNGRIPREAGKWEGICKYAQDRGICLSEIDPTKSTLLIDSLRSVWNGSPAHEKALATVISCLGLLNCDEFRHDEAATRRQ